MGPEAIYAQEKGFFVRVVDNDLAAIKKARKQNHKLKLQYSEFFSFSKRIRKDAYDIVIDNGFSHSLRRGQLNRFYKEISRMLKYNGKLFTKNYSDTDPYCKKHCPKRKWTYVDDKYLNFFSKTLIIGYLRKYGLSVNSNETRKYPEAKDIRIYHIIISTLKSMKISAYTKKNI